MSHGGLYVPGWNAISRRAFGRIVDFAHEHGISSLMIDVKNAHGETFLGGPDWAVVRTAEGHKRSLNLEYIQERAAGLDLKARHVMFRDRALYNNHPEFQLHRIGPEYWVDARNQDVLQYNQELIAETEATGVFSEIVLDYIRFPATQLYGPHSEKCDVIDSVVGSVNEYVETPIGAQVFGYAAWHHNKAGVGQRLPTMADSLATIYPMIYPNHFHKGSFGYDDPADYPYEFISMGVQQARERVDGKSKIVPMLQGFSYNKADYVRQLEASRDNNADYVWWHPSGSYDRLREVYAELRR